jgi:hypothetical protein
VALSHRGIPNRKREPSASVARLRVRFPGGICHLKLRRVSAKFVLLSAGRHAAKRNDSTGQNVRSRNFNNHFAALREV